MSSFSFIAQSIQKESHLPHFKMLLLNSLYETKMGLCHISMPHNLDIFLVNKFEIPLRFKIFQQNYHKNKQYAFDIVKHHLMPSHVVIGGSGAVVSAAIVMTYHIIGKMQLQKFTESNLSAHVINDLGHLAIDPIHRDQAYYHPKTVLAIKGYHAINNNPEIYENVKSQIETFLRATPNERLQIMDKYTRIKEITKKDCQKDDLPTVLIGQKGIFAPRKISQHTIIGCYTGLCLHNKETFHRITLEMGVRNCGNYLFGFTEQEFPIISPFKYGNRMSLMNAPTCYDKPLDKVAQEIVTRNNVVALYVKTAEYPDKSVLDNLECYDMVFYMTYKDVPQNKQLYIDYGKTYWKNKTQNLLEVTGEELAQAVKSLTMKSLLKTNHKKYLR